MINFYTNQTNSIIHAHILMPKGRYMLACRHITMMKFTTASAFHSEHITAFALAVHTNENKQ
jgi:hypothetical protein